MESSDRSEVRSQVDRIVADYEEALNAGNAPSLEDFLAQHGDLEQLLRARLEPKTRSGDDRTEQWADGDSSSTSDAPTHVYVSGSSSASVRDEHLASGPSIGSQIGEYRLIKQLGQGGMGVVYDAEHLSSGRRIALKLLSPELPRTDDTINRFLNEAALAAGLSHPRTTFIYEAGEVQGHFFIAMELMPGRTLRDTVEEHGPLPVSQAVDYILDVLDGLEAAHKAGVVHRDVKPSNCFLDGDGRVKVGDFGLSKSLVAESDLTRTGTFLGTPQFAAPEQFRRTEVDHRTDEFAVGATLYYLLSGTAPFTGDAAAVIAQIVADDPPPIQDFNSDVPQSLGRIIARSMRKDPKDRFRDVHEFRQALMPYSSHGTSIADVGRRVAALLIDSTLLSIVVGTVTMLFVVLGGLGQEAMMGIQGGLFAMVAWIPYFAISEGVFGCSLAKYWLGLRVVDSFGEKPGIMRATLRALILPGMTWVTIDILHYRYNTMVFSEATIFTSLDVWTGFLVPQFFAITRGALCLLVCSSMRAKNGFRGWHELLSGTRVVRLADEGAAEERLVLPAFSPTQDVSLPQSIGRFHVLGRLGTFGDAEVLASIDEQLDRLAWLYVTDREMKLSAERIRLVRHTRQRWLQGGELDGKHWFAMEAVEGVPVTEAARFADIPWSVSRNVLMQAAEEVRASREDSTLPDQLELRQVWINDSGRLCLLDEPLDHWKSNEVQVRQAAEHSHSTHQEQTSSAANSSQRLLCQVAEICSRDEETPGTALDLIEDMKRNPVAESLAGICDRLSRIVKQPYRFRWDDRLGVLAISGGMETVLYGSVGFGLAMVIASRMEQHEILSVSIAIGIGLILPALFAFTTRGGLAFWLTKTQVRTPSRKLAGRWRCAWRSIVAWAPVLACQSYLGILIADLTSLMDSSGNPISGHATLMWSATGLIAGIFGLVQLAGAIFAVLQPRRGFQDLIAGTQLVRR